MHLRKTKEVPPDLTENKELESSKNREQRSENKELESFKITERNISKDPVERNLSPNPVTPKIVNSTAYLKHHLF